MSNDKDKKSPLGLFIQGLTEGTVIFFFIIVETVILLVDAVIKSIKVLAYPIRRGKDRYQDYKTRKAMKGYDINE